MSKFKITSESRPVYQSAGNLTDYWGCDEWADWYYALKDKYGKKKAKEIWEKAWDDNPKLSYVANWTALDCRLREPFHVLKDKEGVDVYTGLMDKVAAKTMMGVSKAPSKVVDAGEGVVDTVESASKGVFTIGRSLKYVVPIVVGVALVGAGIFAYNAFIKTGTLPVKGAAKKAMR